MVFSSHLFLFYFLPLVLLLNYLLPFRYLSLMLVVLSYCFYGWMNPAWVLVMFTSSFIDYWCGLALIRFSGLPMDGPELPMLPRNEPRKLAQKIALGVSITSNLAILGFFKYFDFGLANLHSAMAALGFGQTGFHPLRVALPIGISFYTFQSMSYAIDVYRGQARPLRNPIDFACFVALFPHQLAGPIIRYWSIADQFRARSLTYAKFARGAAFVCLGLSKKILLANPMAHIADTAFSAGSLHAISAWYGVVGRGGLLAPALLRFLRLFRYGCWSGPDAWVSVYKEFRRSLSLGKHYGFLAPLAYCALHLASGLPVRHHRREPPG